MTARWLSAAATAAVLVVAPVTVSAIAVLVDLAQDLSLRCRGDGNHAADGHAAAGLHG